MTERSEMLMVIPARGGSKRLPRKNVLSLMGKPLICWTIEAALETGLSARIMVTSDDEEILSISRRYAERGVISHKRPAELATDDASTLEVLQEALYTDQQAGFTAKVLILLQPTSPLRSSVDICAAVEAYERSVEGDTVVSVCAVGHPTAWIGKIDEDGYIHGLDLTGERSQDHQQEYRLNGAVYVISAKSLHETGGLFAGNLRAFVMPQERSIDIDERIDFEMCEIYVAAESR